MQLDDGQNHLSGVFTYEGDLVAASRCRRRSVDDWRGPRQVGDFAQDVTMPVGVKRSLFKRTVAPETITLDDYVIGGFELRDDRCELRLRRRAEAPDALVFTVTPHRGQAAAEVHHPEDVEAESGLPAVLDGSSAVEVERLWQLLRNACAPVLARKQRMVSLTLDGDDVAEHDLGTKVVALVVGAIAPTVSEVARRSPNAHELSLKVENDSGRREEIYLRKAQLVSSLSSVTPKERGVFDPLGLIASGPRESMESLTRRGHPRRVIQTAEPCSCGARLSPTFQVLPGRSLARSSAQDDELQVSPLGKRGQRRVIGPRAADAEHAEVVPAEGGVVEGREEGVRRDVAGARRGAEPAPGREDGGARLRGGSGTRRARAARPSRWARSSGDR